MRFEVFVYVAEALNDGHHGDDGLVDAGSLVAAADDLDGSEGAHTVVDAD